MTPRDLVRDRIGCAQAFAALGIRPGGNRRYPCPVNEHGRDAREPATAVFGDGKRWKCHKCAEGGDVFSLVEHVRGTDFRDALHFLASLAGVEVSGRPDPEAAREWRRRKVAGAERKARLVADMLGSGLHEDAPDRDEASRRVADELRKARGGASADPVPEATDEESFVSGLQEHLRRGYVRGGAGGRAGRALLLRQG